MTLLIKGGQVVCPKSGINEVMDILLCNGKITKIGNNLSDSADRSIDGTGLIVAPGFIDMHVHLREPGREDKETIETGTAAAIRGGFTSIAAMPNTDPVADNKVVVEYVKKKAKIANKARVYPIGAITKNISGQELAELGEMEEAGVVGFSDDGNEIMNSEIMRTAMEYAAMFNRPIISHSEDKNLSKDGVMHKGYISSSMGLKGIPPEAEDIMVARNILLAEAGNAQLHLAHVSTAGSLRHIKDAKDRGVRVSCEVTPHHISLTHEALVSFDTNFKMNPPLRSSQHVNALISAIKDGTIDVIATDHAPHTVEEKESDFASAPFGIVGLETAVPVVITELYHKAGISMEKLVELMSVNPAKILGLDNCGSLEMGSWADITIIDPNESVVIDSSQFVSLGRNTPYDGQKFKGKVKYTIIGGEVLFEG